MRQKSESPLVPVMAYGIWGGHALTWTNDIVNWTMEAYFVLEFKYDYFHSVQHILLNESSA